MGSGLIGTDPYDESSWSGISRRFFKECQRQGILHRAFGVEVEPLYRIPLMLKNVALDREVWRQQFYLDTAYYARLSRAIVRELREDERAVGLLQLGGIYDLRPHVGPSRRLMSYHDGNLAQAIQSPWFPSGVSQTRIERALEYERSVYQNLDLIFAMSEYLQRSFIQDFGVDEQKAKVIGAGVNLDAIPEPSQGKPYDSKKVLFVGADFERKGGANVLRAFQRSRTVHPTATLSIIGPRRLHIPAELSSGVVYEGFLSKSDDRARQRFERILRESCLFVMPSLYEPFGIAPLEAMAYEIPPILTAAWAFPEMVEPGKTGELVACDDSAELADKMIELLGDPALLEAMGRAGRQQVMRKFTWQSVVQRLSVEISRSTPTRSDAGSDGESGLSGAGPAP